MFTLNLGPEGYRWACTIGTCHRSDTAPNAAEAADAAIRHRDADHPEAVWSATRQRAALAVTSWMSSLPGGGDVQFGPADVMRLVNEVADALGEVRRAAVQPSPAEAVADWGRSPLNMDNMHDIRLIEAPQPEGPTRNWTTNHMVRWSVGEAIQSPPEGRGCQAKGARVGEDVEVCALPGHNPANVKHVFAIGERVTRIANW